MVIIWQKASILFNKFIYSGLYLEHITSGKRVGTQNEKRPNRDIIPTKEILS